MMVLRKFLLSLLFLATGAQAVTYQDPLNPKSSFTVTAKSIILVDVEKPAKRCANSDPYICIKSESFSLAIPRSVPTPKWSFEGSQYEIIARYERGIYGRSYDYEVIRVSGVLNFHLLYSKRAGVIAIREPSGNTLLPDQECGILVQDESGGCD
jgi:hypothetical protein